MDVGYLSRIVNKLQDVNQICLVHSVSQTDVFPQNMKSLWALRIFSPNTIFMRKITSQLVITNIIRFSADNNNYMLVSANKMGVFVLCL